MAYRQGYRPQTGRQQVANGGRAQQSRQTKRKSRTGPLKVFLALVVLALLATGGVMGYMMYEEVSDVERRNTFYPGVHVDGVSLYGAQPDEAVAYLVNKTKEGIQGWQITLRYGEQSWQITPDTLGMGGSIEAVVQDEVNKAFLVGRSDDSFIDRYRTIVDLKEQPYQGYTANIEKNTSLIDAIISEIQATVYRSPVDATWVFDLERRNPIVITAEQYGQELDAAALKEQIIQMVNTMDAGDIQIEPKPILPAVLASELENKVVLLGNYSSEINKKSTTERNMNIERGCLAFHGRIVKPDEKVSFNSWVGPRTEKNGFYEAQEIVSGAYEWGVGGGICQVSSTLYNAVIQANLRVRDRKNHGIPVNYMPMGADATVYDGRIDFVFQNNTGQDIYLVARVESSGNKKFCTFQIYGRPDPSGFTYSLSHETIEEIPIPEPEYIKDRKAEHVTYTDQTYEASKGAKGYKVRTYLVIKDAHGSVFKQQELYVDTYKAQAPQIYVGVTPRS